jgi:hypothetical protein
MASAATTSAGKAAKRVVQKGSQFWAHKSPALTVRDKMTKWTRMRPGWS